jgi:hypothetical protein
VVAAQEYPLSENQVTRMAALGIGKELLDEMFAIYSIDEVLMYVKASLMSDGGFEDAAGKMTIDK